MLIFFLSVGMILSVKEKIGEALYLEKLSNFFGYQHPIYFWVVVYYAGEFEGSDGHFDFFFFLFLMCFLEFVSR